MSDRMDRTAALISNMVNQRIANQHWDTENNRAQQDFDFKMGEAKRAQRIRDLPGQLFDRQNRPGSVKALPIEDTYGAEVGPQLPPVQPQLNVTPPPAPDLANTRAKAVAAGGSDTEPTDFDEAALNAATLGLAPLIKAGGAKIGDTQHGNPMLNRWADWQYPGAAPSEEISGDAGLAAQRKKFWAAHDAKMPAASNVADSLVQPPSAHPEIVPGSTPGLVTPPTNPTTAAAPATPPAASAAPAAPASPAPVALPSVAPDFSSASTMPLGESAGFPGGVMSASQLPPVALDDLIRIGAQHGATPAETIAALNQNADAYQGGLATTHTPMTPALALTLATARVDPRAHTDARGNVDMIGAASDAAGIVLQQAMIEIQQKANANLNPGDQRLLRTSAEQAADAKMKVTQIDSTLQILEDPSSSYEAKVNAAQSLLPTISGGNAEVAKQLGESLDFKVFNVRAMFDRTQHGFGRDLKGFTEQVKRSRGILEQVQRNASKTMDDVGRAKGLTSNLSDLLSSPAPGGAGGVTQISSQEEFARLPKGAQFSWNGRVGVKH